MKKVFRKTCQTSELITRCSLLEAFYEKGDLTLLERDSGVSAFCEFGKNFGRASDLLVTTSDMKLLLFFFPFCRSMRFGAMLN